VGDALPPGFEWFAAGHPDPNQASVDAGRRALAMAAECTGERVLVVLLSGGASALLAVPAAGLTLAEKMATTRAVMQAGAAIDELNCVRKHLSRLKGGQLGAAAERVVTLAISDVHGPVPDDPSVIGSGPTVPDPTTYADALAIVRRVQADERRGVSDTAVRHLERGTRGLEPETIKPGDPRLAGAELHIIANRLTAIEGARQAASALGYEVVVLPGATTGEARDAAGIFFDAAAPFVSRTTGPLCVLAAGETTVRVTGAGRGGRNQEFALALAGRLASATVPMLVASAGTDGIDGPTDAAGAVVDASTLDRARARGLDAVASLADNDAYAFFAPLGDLIMWGPTGTNVGDLHVLLVPPAATSRRD
jgi:glycerate-2-kinase